MREISKMAAGIAASWLQPILSQYFAMVPLRHFKWEVPLQGPEVQKMILDETIRSRLSEQFPPSRSYQKKFIKTLMQRCEESGSEIYEDIYSVYADLISGDKNEDICFKTYFLPNGSSVSIQETVQLISHGTTGLCTWPASLYMTEWIVDNTIIFKNKRVLELGSGCGLLGLALCKLCQPKHFCFSDFHRHVMKSLLDNVQNNLGQECEDHTVTLDNAEQSREAISQDSSQGQSQVDGENNSSSRLCFQGNGEGDVMRMNSLQGATDGLTASSVCDDRSGTDASVGSTCNSLSINDSRISNEQGQPRDRPVSPHFSPTKTNTDSGQPDSLLSHHRHSEDAAYLYKSDTVSVLTLDWEQVTREELDHVSPGVVIAADVVFDPSIVTHLVNVLDILLSRDTSGHGPVTAYVASTVRSEETFQLFLKELGNQLITVEILEGPSREIFYYDKTCPIKLIKLSKTGH